jgi:nucleotide-binding universal stress UspA family protein
MVAMATRRAVANVPASGLEMANMSSATLMEQADVDGEMRAQVNIMREGKTMSYAALMVHLGGERGWSKRVRLAADLANRFHSTLIGTAGWLPMPAYALDGTAVSDETIDNERNSITALLAEMEEKFRAAAKHVDRVEWRGTLDYPRDLVPREARAADLLIIGRERVPGDPYFSLNPGIAILRAGRPVLVVPDQIDSLTLRRVVVAWKDTREARRAVRDALPFLRHAAEVIIVAVCEEGTEAQSQKQIDDVATYLARHKVVVGEKIFLRAEQSIANELLRVTNDENADLIVAGGYGHSRLGEWMFGGVTRDLLANSQVCCLFSH